MILYIDAITNMDYVHIDSILITDKNGKDHELTWDDADFSCTKSERPSFTKYDFSGNYKRIYIDDEYDNKKLDDIMPFTVKDIVIDEAGDDLSDLDNLLFSITRISLCDNDKGFNLTCKDSRDDSIYMLGECPPFINLLLEGEVHFDVGDTFKLSYITIVDRYGIIHSITWDDWIINIDVPARVGGVITPVTSIQLQNIHIDEDDEEGLSVDDMEDYTPFMIADIGYEYKGERPNDVWFCIHKLELINGLSSYLTESDEPIYSTWWNPPE